MKQLRLPLVYDQQDHAGAFIIAQPNRVAAMLIDNWQEWPNRAALIIGPPGCGKSSLGRAFATHLGGQVIGTAQELGAQMAGPLGQAATCLVIDDLHLLLGPTGPSTTNEEGLFHLLNRAQFDGLHLLLLSGQSPADLRVALPDLASRIAVLPSARIEQPDDELLAALFIKGLRQAGLAVPPAVLSYAVERMDRSYAGVAQLIPVLDQLALENRRELTKPLIAEALARLG